MSSNREHLSEIQDLCTGDEPEFVLGSIHGLREWSLNDGSYFPVEDSVSLPGMPQMVGHFGKPWDVTKTLEAVCYADPVSIHQSIPIPAGTDPEDVEYLVRSTADGWFKQLFSEHTNADVDLARCSIGFPGGSMRPADWLLDDPYDEFKGLAIPPTFRRWNKTKDLGVIIRVSAPQRPHLLADPRCTCGVYAYHNRESLVPFPDLAGIPVFGLIKAYGNVTVGTKGLRAEKADVVALTTPVPHPNRPRDILDQVDAAVSSWLDHGIILVDTLEDLLTFADRGGYLTPPEELRNG